MRYVHQIADRFYCFLEAMNVLEVKFIGDGDALEHIVDKQEGMFNS